MCADAAGAVSTVIAAAPALTGGGRRARNDDKTAAELRLQGGATLHLVLALRGGQSGGGCARPS